MEFHTDERDWRNFVATWRVGNRLGNLRSMRQNFELKNWDAIVPQKTVPRSSTLWKDSRLPEREGKKKKNRSKAAGKQARRSDAALQRRTSSPRARKGSDDCDTKTLPNIPFHTGKGRRRGGVYGTPL